MIHHQATPPTAKSTRPPPPRSKARGSPGPCTGSGTWELDDLKTECARRAGPARTTTCHYRRRRPTHRQSGVVTTGSLGDTPEESRPARWRLTQIQGTVRHYLGGWTEKTGAPRQDPAAGDLREHRGALMLAEIFSRGTRTSPTSCSSSPPSSPPSWRSCAGPNSRSPAPSAGSPSAPSLRAPAAVKADVPEPISPRADGA